MTGKRSILSHAVLAQNHLLYIAVGGSLGSLARFVITQKLNGQTAIAWGTLGVNLLGSLLLGFAVSCPLRTDPWQLGLCVGFLGSFTTLSAVAVELTANPGQAAVRCGYLGLTLAGGLLAARLGLFGGSRINRMRRP